MMGDNLGGLRKSEFCNVIYLCRITLAAAWYLE